MMRVVHRGPSVAMTQTRRTCNTQKSASRPGRTVADQPNPHNAASQRPCIAMIAG